MTEEIDLFGHAIRPGYGRRGKPPHQPTEEDRNRVKMLLALGWDDGRIAAVLGVCKKTFRKHYFPELKCRAIARDAMEASTLEVLWRESQAGRVTAIDRLHKFLDRHDAETAERRMKGREQEKEAPPRRAPPKGKKEVDKEAALSAEENLAQRWGGLH